MYAQEEKKRTVPIPIWVKAAIDRWRSAANVTTGGIFRAISRHGTVWGKGIAENVIWYVVRRCAERMQLDHLAPHDLRRTCAKLGQVSGGELEATWKGPQPQPLPSVP